MTVVFLAASASHEGPPEVAVVYGLVLDVPAKTVLRLRLGFSGAAIGWEAVFLVIVR
jgi:hypothetical protein